jgi:hypothetical protein
MAGMCRGQNCQFQHDRTVSRSKAPVLAYMILWSTLSVSAWLDCAETPMPTGKVLGLRGSWTAVVVNMISFSMAGMCRGPNRQFQHTHRSSNRDMHILLTIFLLLVSTVGRHRNSTKGQPARQMALENREHVFVVMPTKFYILYMCSQGS